MSMVSQYHIYTCRCKTITCAQIPVPIRNAAAKQYPPACMFVRTNNSPQAQLTQLSFCFLTVTL